MRMVLLWLLGVPISLLLIRHDLDEASPRWRCTAFLKTLECRINNIKSYDFRLLRRQDGFD
jgi:hypothetical protein